MCPVCCLVPDFASHNPFSCNIFQVPPPLTITILPTTPRSSRSPSTYEPSSVGTHRTRSASLPPSLDSTALSGVAVHSLTSSPSRFWSGVGTLSLVPLQAHICSTPQSVGVDICNYACVAQQPECRRWPSSFSNSDTIVSSVIGAQSSRPWQSRSDAS